MRFKASLGALAGIVWLASAAAVPRLDNALEMTCSSTDAAEATAFDPKSTCSTTILEPATTAVAKSNCSTTAFGQATISVTTSPPIPKVLTITVTSSTTSASSVLVTSCALPGLIPANSSFLGSVSSSCASSATAGSASQNTDEPRTITITESTAFCTTTISVPAATVTLPGPSSAAQSVATVTVSDDIVSFGPAAAVTAAPDPETVTVTVPEPIETDAILILTLTFPDGVSHTSTMLFTVTIPKFSLSPGLWSTVTTPSAITEILISQEATLWPAESRTANAVSPSLSNQSADSTSQVPDPYRPYALTYTLPPVSGRPTPFTGTITITPTTPSTARATSSSRAMYSSRATTGTEPFFPPAVVSAAGPSLSAAAVASTVIGQHNSPPPASTTAIPQPAPVTSRTHTGTPIVTLMTPHPISNTLGTSVPLIGFTVTVTYWPEDFTASVTTQTAAPLPPQSTATSVTSQTASPVSPPADGHDGGFPALSSDVQPDVITVTVTAITPPSSAVSAISGSAASSGVHTVAVTAAVSGISSSSIGSDDPYGPGVDTDQGTVTITLPLATSKASSVPDQESEDSFTTLTVNVPDISGYGSFSSATRSSDSPVDITTTDSVAASTPTPSSPIPSAPKPLQSFAGSVVFVTYTLPGHSGVGGSSYTVTYTLPPTTTSNWDYGGGSGSPSSNPTPSQTSELASVVTVTAIDGNSSPGPSNSGSPLTLTMNPTDASGTPITITDTPGQPKPTRSSTFSATTSFINTGKPVSATPQASDYGALPSSSRSGIRSPSPSDTTISSDSLVMATSDAAATTAVSADQPAIVTVTEMVPAPSRSVPGSSAPTATAPSSSPALVSSNADISTNSGGYEMGTTGPLLPTSASGQPVVVTVTEGVSSSSESASIATIVVSVVTLSQTVPHGYDSSTVIKFTTEVTVVPGSSSSTAPTSGGLITSLSPTWTSSNVFPPRPTSHPSEGPSTLTPSPYEWPVLGSNETAAQSIQSSVIITIWPPATSPWSSPSSPIVSPQPISATDMDSPELSTSYASTADMDPTSALSSSSCTLESSAAQSVGDTTAQTTGSTPSEVTIWPSPAFNTSCSTFATSYLSSTESVSFSTITVPLFSVTTLSPASTSTAVDATDVSSSCTDTLLGASGIMVTDVAGTSESEIPVSMTPPPQTDFHHHAHNATDSLIASATGTLGGYVFSDQEGGDGNPASGYGSPIRVTTVRPTNPVSTDTNLPLSQPSSASSTPLAYGATTGPTTESSDPNATSSSSAPTTIEPNTTATVPSGIAPTSSSAVPVPIITSLGPSHNLTSTHISLSQTPIPTTRSPLSTTMDLPTASPLTESSIWLNSTSPISSSSEGHVPSAVPPPNFANTTIAISASPLPSSLDTTASSNAQTTSSGVSISTAAVNGTASESPVILTLTMTTTFTSGTISTSFTVAQGTPFSMTDATDLTTLSTTASSAAANATSFFAPPGVTSSGDASLTGIATVPTIATSVGLIPNTTVLSSPPALTSSTSLLLTNRPLLNTTALSTTSVIVAATATPSVPTVFLNSSTPVPASNTANAGNDTSSAPTVFGNSTKASITALTSDAMPTTSSVIPVLPSEFIDSTASATASSESSAITSRLHTSSASDATSVPNPVPSAPIEIPPISSALPVACGADGDRGMVSFEFDDIQNAAVEGDADESGTQGQQISSPYHRFVFSEGFHVVSSRTAKYEPSSGSQMLQHASSSAAQIGLAQLRDNSCFRFDFRGMSLGCDSVDPPCIFHITGLQWNGVEDAVQGDTTIEMAACPEPTKCALSHQILAPEIASSLVNLTAINITLVASSDTQIWWADDLQVAWTDDDCTAAACRARARNNLMTPRPQGSLAGKAPEFLRRAVRG